MNNSAETIERVMDAIHEYMSENYGKEPEKVVMTHRDYCAIKNSVYAFRLLKLPSDALESDRFCGVRIELDKDPDVKIRCE